MGAYIGAAIDLQTQPDGTIRDAVTGALAAINRTGSVYGIDPITGKLKAFGANLLAAEKYPNGGGYWAAGESAATNRFINSMNTSDVNADGFADGFVFQGYNATDTKSLIDASDFLDGAKWQRISMTGTAAQSIYNGRASIKDVLNGLALAPSTTYSVSLFYRYARQTGCNPGAFCEFTDAAGAYYGLVGATSSGGAMVLDNSATIRRCTYTITTPAALGSAAKITLNVGNASQWHEGDTFGIDFTAIQVELAYPTSFIPTTTAPVLRPYDQITYPSAALGSGSLTVAVVAVVPWNVYGTLFDWVGTGGRAVNDQQIGRQGTGFWAWARSNSLPLSASTIPTANVTAGVPHVFAGRWDVAAGAIKLSVDGVHRTASTGYTRPLGLGVNFGIANSSGYLHRMVAFTSLLSDAEIAALSTSLLAGTLNARRRRPIFRTLGGITKG